MSATLHKTDFHAWTIQQADLLKNGRLDEADIEHLIEEIESMGARERSQLENRLRVLIGHLLKWEYEPSHRSKSWMATIKEQRLSIADLIEENPSLKSFVEDKIRKAYPKAVLLAVRETSLNEKTFPKTCPYSRDEITDEEFLPD